MKIILIGPAHPFRGGISDFNEVLGQHLEEQEHEVILLSFKKQYPKLLFPGKTQVRTHDANHRLKISSKIHAYQPLNWNKVNHWIKEQNADLILVRYWTPFMAPALGSILRGLKKNLPIIAITDNIVPHERKFYDTPLTRFFLKKVSACITLSASVKVDLLQLAPKMPVVVSPHPIYNQFGTIIDRHEARKRLHIAPDQKLVLFFGLVRAYKGLDLLLDALLTKEAENEGITLLLAGEFYDKKEKYAAQLDRLNQQNRLIALEYFIPDDEVSAIFCAADIVTQTYHTATQSGVTQIAYHFEKPMLVTNVGGLPEIVPDGKAGYVVPKNKTAIAHAMTDFFKNNTDFSSGIQQEKKKYSWERFSQAIFDLKDQLR